MLSKPASDLDSDLIGKFRGMEVASRIDQVETHHYLELLPMDVEAEIRLLKVLCFLAGVSSFEQSLEKKVEIRRDAIAKSEFVIFRESVDERNHPLDQIMCPLNYGEFLRFVFHMRFVVKGRCFKTA